MALTVEHIKKSFGEKIAVNDLSFEVSKPGVFGLIGTNGAGKTTTIRMILGIMHQDAGSILWDGKSVCKKNVRFGYMPEERGIYVKNKVLEQLVYFARLHGMSSKEAEESALSWMEKVGVTEYKDMTADKLSKGNQQKVQLIAALVHNPELIFLDEPFSGLDPLNTEIFNGIIEELTAQNKYIIMSSHQMATVEEYCKEIVILDKGKTLLKGNLRDIKAGYGHTNLVVSAAQNTELLAKECGLVPILLKANQSEYKITGDAMAQDFLNRLLQSGIYPTKYEIREPSLHEIFIEKVGNAQ